jgi:pSer/pThr/pTyr-binding forkhead associated (FHA) protein
VSSDPPLAKPKYRDNRKIIGVLASYTWQAEGQVFPVREGRTHIGAGQIKEDTEHRVVDVHCPDDDLLSEDHAVILVQQKKFWIRDLDSTNGTFLNGEQLRPDAAEELPNNSEIKTGKTVFTFLKIEPKSAAVTEPRRESPASVKEAAPVKDKTILR